jgi:predicted N-acetyltransferase YhbS
MTFHVDAIPPSGPVPAAVAPADRRAAEIRVTPESLADVAAREALLDEAFGLARRTRTSERLREGRQPAKGLALTARDRGKLVGTLRCWAVEAGGRPALLLGPLAVARSHRLLGIGSRLMGEALRRAATGGHKAVLLVGDAPYYARFGFDAALTAKLDLPGPVDRARFLAFEIEAGALDGADGMVVAAGERGAVRRRARPALRLAA